MTLIDGKNITWVLIVALILGIAYLAKFTRDFVTSMLDEFKLQLREQKKESDARECKLNEQLKDATRVNERCTVILEKIDMRLDNIEDKIGGVLNGK